MTRENLKLLTATAVDPFNTGWRYAICEAVTGSLNTTRREEQEEAYEKAYPFILERIEELLSHEPDPRKDLLKHKRFLEYSEKEISKHSYWAGFWLGKMWLRSLSDKKEK